MKIILWAILFIIPFASSGQNWCDSGANWKYSFINVAVEGYTEIKYAGDTIISGQPAKILDKHLYAYDYIFTQPIDFDLGQEYTYENNGVVFLWYNNSWDTLYNFNATVGESWRMAKQPITNACDTNSTLTVISTGSKIINAIPLNYLVVEYNYGGFMPSGITDTIVEKIGFIGGYMLPYDACDGALDGNEGGMFRCYEDDSFITYNPHYNEACDYIVGLNESIPSPNLEIVPNPANTLIELLGLDEPADIMIMDLHGKAWPIIEENNMINVHELPNGIYILSIRKSSGIYYRRFVKQ